MTSLARLAALVALCAAVPAPAVAADRLVPLARVAAENGYVYAFLASEAAVSLSRPGVVVVLRAGQSLYRVGDGYVAADRAPEFVKTDLFVTPAVAAELHRIAIAHPLPPAPDRPQMPVTSATGTLTVDARQVAGRDAIAVSGRGPAGVPIVITLTGEISRDIPIVVFSRASTRTAADGSYAVLIGLSAGPPRDTTLVATATSVQGVKAANARVILKETSPSVNSPLDRLPQ